MINVVENVTCLVTAPGEFRAVLRLHREAYHSLRAIECALAWAAALHADGGVVTPAIHTGTDGARIQAGRTAALPNPRFMVLFHFGEGREPNPSHDLIAPFCNRPKPWSAPVWRRLTRGRTALV